MTVRPALVAVKKHSPSQRQVSTVKAVFTAVVCAAVETTPDRKAAIMEVAEPANSISTAEVVAEVVCAQKVEQEARVWQSPSSTTATEESFCITVSRSYYSNHGTKS